MLPPGLPGLRLEVEPCFVAQDFGWGTAAHEPSVSALCPGSCCMFQKPPEPQTHLPHHHTAWSSPWGSSSLFHCWCSWCPTVWPAASGLRLVEVPPSNRSIHRGPVHGSNGSKRQFINTENVPAKYEGRYSSKVRQRSTEIKYLYP